MPVSYFAYISLAHFTATSTKIVCDVSAYLCIKLMHPASILTSRLIAFY